ncbi:MAG: hypothetical protein JKX84_00135 [Flavobacteriales bacterium]|nr:hypothetical protein [Flavobacteriales bacterium]
MVTTITGKSEREYWITLNPIKAHLTENANRHKSCVLVVASVHDNGRYDIIGIYAITDFYKLKNHFKMWDNKNHEGIYTYPERKAGATHYGIIPCLEEETCRSKAEDIRDVHGSVFGW